MRMKPTVVLGLLLFAAVSIRPTTASAWWGHGHHYHYGHHQGCAIHFGLSFPLYYGGYASRSVRVHREPSIAYGVLTLDVQPESAHIFLNGQRLGTAADLRDQRLSVEEGEHQLRLKSGAFSTFYRIRIRPGTTTQFSRTIRY